MGCIPCECDITNVPTAHTDHLDSSGHKNYIVSGILPSNYFEVMKHETTQSITSAKGGFTIF